MNRDFENSKWIWVQGEAVPDSYAEFAGVFDRRGDGAVHLSLSFDGICNVYVNGRLVYFKQCADYPHYKLYDRIDITEYCTEKNDIRFAVWYLGEDSSVYYKSEPGIIFEVSEAGHRLLASGAHILSGIDRRYKNNYCKKITRQLGYSFFFDNTAEERIALSHSTEVEKNCSLTLNPLKQMVLGAPSECRIIARDEGNILCDLGKEEAGFLSLSIYSSAEQTVTVAFGEHIDDGNVRRIIDERDFSAELRLKAGENTYTNYFRRIAARYLSIYFEHPAEVRYMGILPTVYPVEKKEFKLQNERRQRIYDVCVRTLELCMHEHYEDCPWREQALYVMDSRNQMLCGYYAFGEYKYARQNLVLMAHGLCESGLLELTYPARNTPAIPFFSLVYPMAVYEYIQYSGDESLLLEVAPVIKSIMNVFSGRIGENGLIANLPYPFWNFYEWAEGSHNEGEIMRKPSDEYAEQYDLILNCAYIVACDYFDRLFGTQTDNSVIKSAIKKSFFDEKKGLFRASKGKELFTELGNSLAILANICNPDEEKEIAKRLVSDSGMVSVTLSMQCFKYDALLKAGAENTEYILADIDKNYGHMLSCGATSVWETILGQSDFGGAGSLCHGWSAMPVYYLQRLDKEKDLHGR